jgi:hypothetical protein
MTIQIHALWHHWPWLIPLAALAVFSYLLLIKYENLSSPKRKVLLFIRAAMLFIFFLFIFSPVLLLQWESRRQPLYYALLDASKSMSFKDSGEMRYFPLLSAIKKSGWPDKIKNQGASVKWVLFGDKGRITEPKFIDSTIFSDGLTDLASASPFFIHKENEQEPDARGCFLFSDGLFNAGPDAEQVALSWGVPVFAVTFGDTVEPPHFFIDKIEAPFRAIANSRVPVKIVIGVKGNVRGPLKIEIRNKEKLLAEKEISVFSGSALQEAMLTAPAAGSGEQIWTIRVLDMSSVPGLSRISKNHPIIIEKDKIKIAAVFSRPGWDAHFLPLAIKQDTGISVASFVASGAGDIIQAESFIQRKMADSSEILLFHDFELDLFSLPLLSQIKNYILTGHGLVLIGKVRSLQLKRELDWLPVQSFIKAQEPGPSAGVVQSAWAQGVKLLELPAKGTLSWDQIPLHSYYTYASVKPSVIILQIQEGANINPLLTWNREGKGKIITFYTSSLWKWDFEIAKDQSLRFGDLWPGLVRFASSFEKEITPFYLTFNRKEYTRGELLTLSAEVYDPSFRPLDMAEISIEIKNQGKTTAQYQFSPLAETPGLYEVNIPLSTTGLFTYRAQAIWKGQLLGEKSGSFHVNENPLEEKIIAADIRSMRKIAESTGGKLFSIKEFEEQIPSFLNYQPVPVFKKKQINLANSFLLIFLWIGFLSAEWFLRKKWKLE